MRWAWFISGVVILCAMWWGPIAHIAHHAFFAHMAAHMAVVAIAAPLIALGIAGSRLDPVRRLPKIFSPIPASMVEFVFVWAWHVPQLHHAARSHWWGHIAEQGTFLFSGLLLWLSVLGGDSSQRQRRAASGVIALLLTAMHMTLLGVLIGMASRPLYPHAHGSHGLTAVQDQQLGGAVMILMGGVSYLAGGLGLLAGILRRSATELQEQP